MRPRLTRLHLAACLATLTIAGACEFDRGGLKGKIAAPGVVGGNGGSSANNEEEPPPPVKTKPSDTPPPVAVDAAPPPSMPPPDAGMMTTTPPDAEPPPPQADASPDLPPASSRPPECDRPLNLPLPAVFHNNIPDSDDFTFDNDGYFLVRSGRDIARIAYGGMPEMVVRNVVNDRMTIDSLRVLSGGDIVIADYTADELVRFDPMGGRRRLAQLNSPNKLAHGPNGQLYVVGIEGDIYVVDPDSGDKRMIGRVDGRLRGLTFSVDYKTLYASDGRNNLIYSLQLRPDGTAEAPRVFARNLGFGPDGMTTDACGNIYVAHNSASTIKRVTPKGVVETVANIDRTTSSIAFGSGKQGWNAKTLYTVSVERGGSFEIKLGLPAAPPAP
jgi:sugar lactone lactonase YvrE